MDKNKLKKYEEIRYRIPVTCGFCKYADIDTKNRAVWGTCKLHLYKHMKHTLMDRQLSIHYFGSCPDAEANPIFDGLLGKYSILVKKE